MGALHVAVISLALGGTGDTVLLDFGATWCGPCQQMVPVVEQLAAAGYPIRKVDIDQHRDLAARYRVASIPCFVMLVNGQEVARKVGSATPNELKQMIALGQQARQAPSQPRETQLTTSAAADPALGHIRPYPITSGSPLVSIANCRAFDPNASRRQAPNGQTAPGRQPQPQQPPQVLPPAQPTRQVNPPQYVLPARAPQQQAVASAAPGEPVRPASQPLPHRSPAAAPGAQGFAARALAASVRLKIEDANGFSWGSGTVIDSYDDEALILTCGHVFRASEGRGRITVDAFGPGAPQGMIGEVIHYDLKRDVALLTVATPRRLPAVAVAPPSFALATGHHVVTVGCGGGHEPSVQQSRVTSLNKFVGPANVQVAGQPVQGRSGGGLFSLEGYLVGVCNAADPQDNEGLYAGLPSVYALLDEVRLSDIYKPRNAPRDVQLADTRPAARTSNTVAQPRHAEGGRPGLAHAAALNGVVPAGRGPLSASPLRTASPRMPMMGEAPAPGQLAGLNGNQVPRVMPASLNGQPAVFTANGVANLSPSEQAALAELKRRTAYSEVICVIRRLDDPQGKSEVIVLDRASPEFVRQLVDEPASAGGRLTSFEVHRPVMPILPVSQH